MQIYEVIRWLVNTRQYRMPATNNEDVLVSGSLYILYIVTILANTLAEWLLISHTYQILLGKSTKELCSISGCKQTKIRIQLLR